MSGAIRKEAHETSGNDKSHLKRSGRGPTAVPTSGSPYASHQALDELNHGDHDDAAPIMVVGGKGLTLEKTLEALGDKHEYEGVVHALLVEKLRPHHTSHPVPLAPSGVDLASALGRVLLGQVGAKRAKKASSEGNRLSDDLLASKTSAALCGTCLAVSFADENAAVCDEWARALFNFASSSVAGLLNAISDYLRHQSDADIVSMMSTNLEEKATVSAKHRAAIAEIAGRSVSLLSRCFECLALVHACDPKLTINEENESLPTALMRLANSVLPGESTVAQSDEALDAQRSNARFYMPLAATGALLRCLSSTCEPAQGPKVRALVLRCIRLVCDGDCAGTTPPPGSEDVSEEGSEAAAAMAAATTNITSHAALSSAIADAAAECVGILATRFPSMVEVDKSAVALTPLLSGSTYLAPLNKFATSKAMAKGKGKRALKASLRQVSAKLLSISGGTVDATFDDDDGILHSPNSAANPSYETPADPTASIAFRDTVAVNLRGFDQIYLLTCARTALADGLQSHLAINTAIRRVFSVHEDLTRAVSKDDRKAFIDEQKGKKAGEARDRGKARDEKHRAAAVDA